MKHIITGTGRSGTTLIHRTLTLEGADVGQHELSCGVDGGVGGYSVLPNFSPPYKLITQIRNPIDTINSVLKWNPHNFPDFNLYIKDYPTKELYVLNVWYTLHTYLISKSILSYTLDNLNKGEVSKNLIDLYNLNTTEEKFNSTLQSLKSTKFRNARSQISNITEQILISQDSKLYYDSIKLFNKINNANSKTQPL